MRARLAWGCQWLRNIRRCLLYFSIVIGITIFINECFDVQIVTPTKSDGVYVAENIQVFNVTIREQLPRISAEIGRDGNIIHYSSVDLGFESIAYDRGILPPNYMSTFVVDSLLAIYRRIGESGYTGRVGTNLNYVSWRSTVIVDFEINPRPDLIAVIIERLPIQCLTKCSSGNKNIGPLANEKSIFSDFCGFCGSVGANASSLVGSRQKMELNERYANQASSEHRQPPRIVRNSFFGSALSAFIIGMFGAMACCLGIW